MIVLISYQFGSVTFSIYGTIYFETFFITFLPLPFSEPIFMRLIHMLLDHLVFSALTLLVVVACKSRPRNDLFKCEVGR